MSNSFTETTSVSWFGRLRRSIGGVVIGLLLIIGMVVLLFWNEGRAVTTARSLAEGAGAVVSVGADAVEAANEGKLVHVSGTVTTDSTPKDPDFAISAAGVRLVRNVEMFQWKEESHSETTKKLGGGEETTTTYTYSKEWDDSPIDSSAFKQPSGHQNPSMDVRSRSFQIPEGKLGAFTLDQPVLDKVGGDQPMAIKPGQASDIEAAFGSGRKVSVVDGRIYLGWNPSSPAIGDYRIAYDVAPLGVISVIGQQQGAQFQAYQTIAGDQLLMVDVGNVPAAQMFKDAADANRHDHLADPRRRLAASGDRLRPVHEPIGGDRRLHPAIGQRRQDGNRPGRLPAGGHRRHDHHCHRLVLLPAGARHRHSGRRRADRCWHHLYRTGAAACRHGHPRSAGHTGLTATARQRTPRSRLPRAARAAGSRGASQRR